MVGAGATDEVGVLPAELLDVLRVAVARVLEVAPGDVLPSSRYVEDLGADSLARVEIAEVFEQGVVALTGRPFRIDDEELDGLRSVQESVEFAVAALGDR